MAVLKTVPFPHQAAELALSGSRSGWGFFWEMGTGKTLEAIMQFSRLHDAGEINGLLVLAPNGVHRNWVTDELPEHFASANEYAVHLWMTSKAETKRHAEAAELLLKAPAGALAILCMSYDAIMTEKGRSFAKRFLTKRRCGYVLDESHRIKTPGVQRTKRVLASAAHSAYRRILTGTLVADKPFDVYSQLRFLDIAAWHQIGCASYEAFKATFGVWEKGYTTAGGTTREYPKLVAYRNMELLRQVVAAHGTSLTKESAGIKLPPKLYSKRYFELTSAQRRAYEQLKEQCFAEIGGDICSADLAIVEILRLQQVTSGYLPTDDGEEGPAGLVALCDPNPRVRLLVETVEDAAHQVIVWAKFRQDVSNILAALEAEGISAVRYDGQCSEDELAEAKATFKAGGAQVFVSNPAKGREGLTMNNAKTMVYFNNSHKLEHRRQSEERNHRIGQCDSVSVVDIAAVDTIDSLIIDSLRAKREIADYVQGTEKKEWI